MEKGQEKIEREKAICMIVGIIIALLIAFPPSCSPYTIVDTVYVPDSITVTMSWEEWERVKMLFAQDSLWKREEIRDSILKTLNTRYLEEPSSHRKWLKERRDKIEATKNIDTINRCYIFLRAWFVPDSGASIDWDSLADVTWDTEICPRHPLGTTCNCTGDYIFLRSRNGDVKPKDSDSSRFLFIYLDTTVSTIGEQNALSKE